MDKTDKLTVSRIRVEVLRDMVAQDKLSKSQATQDWASAIEFALDTLHLPKEAKTDG